MPQKRAKEPEGKSIPGEKQSTMDTDRALKSGPRHGVPQIVASAQQRTGEGHHRPSPDRSIRPLRHGLHGSQVSPTLKTDGSAAEPGIGLLCLVIVD